MSLSFTAEASKPQPRANLIAYDGCPSSTLSNVQRTSAHCSCVWHSCNIRCRRYFERDISDLVCSGHACFDLARECDRNGGAVLARLPGNSQSLKQIMRWCAAASP